MVEVELRRPAGDRPPYTLKTVATLRVEDDGSYKTSGDRDSFHLDEILVMDTANQRLVSFAENPQLWARNLHTALRTPYLVPVVVHDSELSNAH